MCWVCAVLDLLFDPFSDSAHVRKLRVLRDQKHAQLRHSNSNSLKAIKYRSLNNQHRNHNNKRNNVNNNYYVSNVEENITTYKGKPVGHQLQRSASAVAAYRMRPDSHFRDDSSVSSTLDRSYTNHSLQYGHVPRRNISNRNKSVVKRSKSTNSRIRKHRSDTDLSKKPVAPPRKSSKKKGRRNGEWSTSSSDVESTKIKKSERESRKSKFDEHIYEESSKFETRSSLMVAEERDEETGSRILYTPSGLWRQEEITITSEEEMRLEELRVIERRRHDIRE